MVTEHARLEQRLARQTLPSREPPAKRIRRGTFRSVLALIAAIRAYVREHNKHPRPFIWTATAAAFLRKITHCKQALETGH